MGNNTETEKRVYPFKEGTIGQKALLGNKGANLCEMTRLGLPVPPGFVITTQVCREYFNNGHQLPPKLNDDVMRAMKQVEKELGTGATFGDPLNPLLFSVRSGAAVSMPGMMDTVLNLGMNDEVVAGLIKRTNNRRWAYDCYRRFIQMFCNVVLGQSFEPFEAVLTRVKTSKGVKHENELSADDMEAIAKEFVSMAGNDVPTDPQAQLNMAIHAVLRSWYTPRAVRYRLYNNIPEDMGTAVNVQAMVFGNMGPGSGTGVAFTRNPATGEAVFYGEYLEDAEGEDVVSGVRTPVSLAFLQQRNLRVYTQLDDIQRSLERHYRDMQDIEFTVQEGRLYILQTRTGKRTAKASVEIAVDMVTEGLITEKEALLRIEPQRMNYFLHPSIDPNAKKVVLAKGLPASPGAATGVVVFCPDDAEKAVANGQNNVILVRCETTADDIHGMRAAVGILTERGGMTSHAAVVARGMGKCCVVGCHDIHVDYDHQQFTTANGQVVRAGEVITLDGVSGEVALGDVPRTAPGSDATFHKVLAWARKYTKLRVCANADTPKDAEVAMSFGADGIGLCRTEHMFFDADRIDVMRAMILSESVEERQTFLEELYGFQTRDMAAMFQAVRGRPVTIRLLDPPLHEFLPQSRTDIEALANRLGRDADAVERAINAHHEMNPMLGFRGCRLSIKYPEITLMQVRAIVSAAMEVARGGVAVTPEIMVPLPCTANELRQILPQIRKHIQEVMDSGGNGAAVDVRVGTMMEVPRACLTAYEIAPLVDFMSFGTNDLTQMTFGFSRDDVSTFLPVYLDKKVLPCDPFTSIDPDGVGQLVKMTVEKARAIDPKIELGVCGEHGGDPSSISFFHTAGLDYVSCSPYRVPIAIIAAAQAAIVEEKTKTSCK